MTKSGRVWSKRRRLYLKPGCDKDGYLHVSMPGNKRQKTRKVHHLVLEAFVGPCPEGMECRHLNGNKQDHRLKNLKWGPGKETAADCKRHGTFNPPVGERAGSSKLTESKVKLIRMLYTAKWLQFRQWELGKLFSVGQDMISRIINRKYWKHI